MGECKRHWIHPHLYIPDKVSAFADHTIPLLEQITPKEIQQIDEVRSRVTTNSQSFDVNPLFYLRQFSLYQEQRTFCNLIVTSMVCALAILGNLYLSLRSYLQHYIPSCHFTNTTVEPNTVTLNPLPVTPRPNQKNSFQGTTKINEMLLLRHIH